MAGYKGKETAIATVLLMALMLGLVGGIPAWAGEDASRFRLPLIRYQGGNFNPRPEALESLLAQVAKRTSIEVRREPLIIDLTDPNLYQYPMIVLFGDKPFEPFSENRLRVLRNYLEFGGFLFIDDSSAKADSGFDASVRKLISDLFPNTPLEKLPRDHSVFRSFYLINQVAGRVAIRSFLEGIQIKGRTALLYSANDLGGAWATNKLGHWNYDMVGGGLMQRKISERLGINIVMYALTLDYKKDMVHLPIILERLRRYESQ